MMHHTMLAFDADLRELTSEIVGMALQTEKQFSDAVDALLGRDVLLAERFNACVASTG